MIKAKKPETYITDGLVLRMDGIEKGSTAGAWTDRVTGHVFEAVNGFMDGENYVGLNAESSQYLRNSTLNIGVEKTDSTIEVVISDYSNGMMIFFPKVARQIAFGTRASSNNIIWSSGGSCDTVVYDNNSKIFSITYQSGYQNALALVNGVVPSLSSGNYFDGADNTYNYIGCRPNNNYATAKIYAIRIYNRCLTLEEMLHNQRVDNARFNLGLTI
jgi:hypothetical protein